MLHRLVKAGWAAPALVLTLLGLGWSGVAAVRALVRRRRRREALRRARRLNDELRP